jgi:hypothetical protein
MAQVGIHADKRFAVRFGEPAYDRRAKIFLTNTSNEPYRVPEVIQFSNCLIGSIPAVIVYNNYFIGTLHF